MKKIKNFYANKKLDKAQGKRLGDRYDFVEDKIIKEELLPLIMKKLKPILTEVGSPLILTIQHTPHDKITISTRGLSLSSLIDNTPTPQPVKSSQPHEPAKKRTRSVQPGFSVTFPDGVTFHGETALDTYVDTLRKIGLQKIYEHPLVPIIAKEFKLVDIRERQKPGIKYPQQEVDGYFIYKNLGTDDKIRKLKKLSEIFGLNLEIERDEEKGADFDKLL